MSDPSTGLLSQEDANRVSGLVKFLMRHFVSLAGTCIDLDDNGVPIGQPRFFACSGFIMSFLDSWYCVTAGHDLRDLQSNTIRVEGCRFVDYLGPNPKVAMPTPFDLSGQVVFHSGGDGADREADAVNPSQRRFAASWCPLRIATIAEKVVDVPAAARWNRPVEVGLGSEKHHSCTAWTVFAARFASSPFP